MDKSLGEPICTYEKHKQTKLRWNIAAYHINLPNLAKNEWVKIVHNNQYELVFIHNIFFQFFLCSSVFKV